MRTSNPVFGRRWEQYTHQYSPETGTMTVEGTAMKTLILLALATVSALFVWVYIYTAPDPLVVFPTVGALMIVGIVGGLIFAFATIFRPQWAHITAPGYALLEGLLLGGITAIFEIAFPGIGWQAVGLTFGVFLLILLLYRAQILRATPGFTKGIIAATGAIFIVYMVSFLLSFFGVNVFFIHDAGPIGIGFSLLVIAIAALNFVLDFALIERGAKEHAPKRMEWYGAFALMVTLVWLYIEILRLLAKMRSR